MSALIGVLHHIADYMPFKITEPLPTIEQKLIQILESSASINGSLSQKDYESNLDQIIKDLLDIHSAFKQISTEVLDETMAPLHDKCLQVFSEQVNQFFKSELEFCSNLIHTKEKWTLKNVQEIIFRLSALDDTKEELPISECNRELLLTVFEFSKKVQKCVETIAYLDWKNTKNSLNVREKAILSTTISDIKDLASTACQ